MWLSYHGPKRAFVISSGKYEQSEPQYVSNTAGDFDIAPDAIDDDTEYPDGYQPEGFGFRS